MNETCMEKGSEVTKQGGRPLGRMSLSWEDKVRRDLESRRRMLQEAVKIEGRRPIVEEAKT